MKEKEKKKIESAPKTDASSSITQKLLPHVIAIVVFAVVNLLFFSPVVFDNKVINQSDIVQYKGMAEELTDYREKTGKEGLWTNSMFGGMPAYQISVKYKGNLIQHFDKITAIGFPHPSQLLFQTMLFFYLLLIIIGVNPWLAIAGGLAYALGSYNLTLLEAGHNSKLHCIALIPLPVAAIILLRQKNYLWGGVLMAISFSLLVIANHLQITYYLLMMLGVFAVVELVYAIREKDMRSIWIAGAIAISAGIFAVANNLSLLWSTYEYLPSTIRGPSELSSNKQSTGGLDQDYAFQWSYGTMESFTLLIPDFYGGSSNENLGAGSNAGEALRNFGITGQQVNAFTSRLPTYWGDVPFTSGPAYVGAIICYLFLLAMFMVKERWKWWLLATSVLALFMAWGRNFPLFNDQLFHFLPGYNRFRTPSMVLVLIGFTFPFLSLVFLNNLVKGSYTKADVKKHALRAFYVVGGLCLLFAVAGGTLFSFSSPNDETFKSQLLQASGNNAKFADDMLAAIREDRASLMSKDAWRSLVFVVLGAGLIWLFAADKIKKNLLIGGLIMFIFADLFFVGRRYLTDENFVSKNEYNRYFEPTPADQLIMKETSLDYRVFNIASNPFTDSRTSYFHKSLGGYHAAKLRRYQEIIEKQLTRNDSVRRSGYPFNKSVVDMLNTKYIIVPGQNGQEQVVPNVQALDNAWFVDSIVMVNNADEEMSALNDINPGTTAIVDKRFASQLENFKPSVDSLASIRLDSYAPNELKYTFKSSKENVAVFAEVYYQPGWNAFIDGKKADHFRCNYILRGMRIPAGEHQIEFRFEPRSYFIGEKVGYASSGIVLLLVLGLIYRDRKKIAQLFTNK